MTLLWCENHFQCLLLQRVFDLTHTVRSDLVILRILSLSGRIVDGVLSELISAVRNRSVAVRILCVFGRTFCESLRILHPSVWFLTDSVRQLNPLLRIHIVVGRILISSVRTQCCSVRTQHCSVRT